MSEPNKLDQFEAELRAEHEALTEAFESSQKEAERVWADHEEKGRALKAFRARYGRVLKALDRKEVTVTEAPPALSVESTDGLGNPFGGG